MALRMMKKVTMVLEEAANLAPMAAPASSPFDILHKELNYSATFGSEKSVTIKVVATAMGMPENGPRYAFWSAAIR